MDYLVAHCPTSGCYMRVPVCTLVSDAKPAFDPAVFVLLVCPSCGKEFREPALELEISAATDVTGKFRVARH